MYVELMRRLHRNLICKWSGDEFKDDKIVYILRQPVLTLLNYFVKKNIYTFNLNFHTNTIIFIHFILTSRKYRLRSSFTICGVNLLGYTVRVFVSIYS